MRKTLVFLILITGLGYGCQKSTNSSFTPDCSGAAKSFQNDVRPIIQSKCVSCHSSGGNSPALETYSQVKNNASAIRSSIIDGRMPRNGSVTDTQKNTIACWVDNGAVNN